jgi:ABC-type lipoprotein export system ATPase subunit
MLDESLPKLQSVSKRNQKLETRNLKPACTSLLELRDVSGACADGTRIDGVSTVFAPGRLHVLRGAPEGGKVAFFRFAGLLEAPPLGEVFIQGSATRSLAEEARTDLRTQRMGFAFAAPFLLGSFSVIENVAMPLFKISHVDPEEARRRTEAILEFVGLAEAAEVPVHELTVPAQYHVAIARGLVNEPAVLMVENVDGVLVGAELEEYAALLRKAAAVHGPAVIATAAEDFKTVFGDRVLDIWQGGIASDSEILPEAKG